MAYTPTPPTVDPSQKGPVLSGANDVPYVGKPKPGIPPTMPPGGTNRPPQKPRYGSSDGSGFDFQAYLAGKHRPRPVQVLPGQGMGPMPVGTRPLPKPTVSGGRNDGYGWAQGQTVGAKPFWTGPPGTEPAPIDWGNAGAFGTKPLPNPVVKDPRTGGGGLEDWMKSHPNGPIYDDWSGSWSRGRGGQSGGQPPWLVGKMLPMDIGPGSANERAQAALRAEWEAKNGPWQGGPTLSTGDNRLDRGDMGMRPPGFDGKGWLNQGGQSVAPGIGMPTQYGGPRDNNAGRLSQQAIAGGLMDDRGYPGAQFGGTQVQMKPGGMGPGGQDPMYGGAGTGPSYGGPTQARDFNVPNYGAPVQRGPMQGPPPVGTGPGSMGKPQQPGSPTQMPGRQPLRPGMEYRPRGGQRPQGGQMQMPPGMHPDVWNQMDEETRMRWAGMWDGGGMQPMLPNEQGQAQMPGNAQLQPMPRQFDPRMGSGYYGAF